MMWTARREGGWERVGGDGLEQLSDESTRRGSLAAIGVSLNTRGPWNDEGKTVSQADVWCASAWKPLDIG
jgi:hypothetical protein